MPFKPANDPSQDVEPGINNMEGEKSIYKGQDNR